VHGKELEIKTNVGVRNLKKGSNWISSSAFIESLNVSWHSFSLYEVFLINVYIFFPLIIQ